MHETISIHKAIAYSTSKGVAIVSKHHDKNIMPEFRNACLQEHAKDALFESFLFSPFPILKKIIQTTNISNIVQKVVSNIFEINLKIN